MLNFLAQTYTTFETTTLTAEDEAGLAALTGGFLLFVTLISLVFLVVMIASLWKIFEKAGVEGWKAIIPVYNGWVLAEIVGKPGWWALVGLGGIIPVVGFIASIAAFVLGIILAIELAKSFGKDPIYAALYVLVPIVGYPMLAFGADKYIGPGGSKSGSKPAAPAAPAA
jgi:hypothetical protein